MRATLPKRLENRMARERAILDAALKVFATAGFTGATMDGVAAEAGLTKPTLYSYFASKEQLFEAMMLAKRDLMLEGLTQRSDQGMTADLVRFAFAYARTVLRPDMLSLARLIIGEVQRFPQIGRAYQASGPDQLLAGIMDYLCAMRAEGHLAFEDAELAAQDLWGLILSAPRNQALHRPDLAPDAAAIARYVENGLRVFLKAYSTQPQADLARLQAELALQQQR